MKRIFLLTAAVMSFVALSAQLSRQEIKQNIYLMGSNYLPTLVLHRKS